MVRHSAGEGRNLTVSNGHAPESAMPIGGRSVPLLITAELPGNILKWADALRKAHYPPERNRLAAHVTLFHALPPSAEGEIRALLGELARRETPMAEISGIMDLGHGTALAVESAGMLALHEHIAEHLHGVLSPRDGHAPRLHITIQNKVDKAAASALQAELKGNLRPYRFRFKGLALHAWETGLWRNIRSYSFRGQGQGR